MSVYLTQYPRKDNINGFSSLKQSKWNAAHHPIVYQLQRKDFVVNSIVDSGGYVKIICASGAELNVDDSIYLQCGPYDSAGTITAVSGLTAVLDIPFTVTAGTGFYNNFTTRPNYRITTKLYWVDSNNTYVLQQQPVFYPDPTGLVKVDVSPYVRRKCSLLNTCTYDVVSMAEPTMGGSFNMIYREDYTGSTNNFVTLNDPRRTYYVNAAKQLRDTYGSNMAVYVPFFDADTVKGKFLHPATKAVYFPGFPFSLGFVYSDDITGIDITREITFKNLNGATVSSTSDAINAGLDHSLRMNHLMLATIPAGATSADVWLQGDDSGTGGDDYFDPNFVDGYVNSRSNTDAPTNPA